MSDTSEPIIREFTKSELNYFAEQAREESERRQSEADGLRKLAARFAADPNAASRCARILATLATDHSSYWDASDVVRERDRRRGDSLDAAAVDLDLDAMCGAGLLDAVGRDDGEEDAPPTTFWGGYAVRDVDLDEMVVLGSERWMAKRIESATAITEPV